MANGILLVDRQGELAFADAPAWQLLGCHNETELRQRWDYFRGRLALPGHTSDAVGSDAGDAAGERVQTLKKDRGRNADIEVRISPVAKPAFDGYVVRIRSHDNGGDITSSQLLGASQARNQHYINSALIHDLRAPLNAMEIHLELLDDNLRGRPAIHADAADALGPLRAHDDVGRKKALQGVAILKEELTRLNRTLRTLLSSDRPFRMAFDAFDIGAALQELVALLTPKARQQRVDIHLDIAEPGLLIEGNKDYLKQAFLNIAINALEAMPEGGALRIWLRREGDRVEVAFVDEGPGVAEAFLRQIYNLYFTTKSQGSGMGLFAAQLVVADAHGGTIEIRNSQSPTKGACVTCRLPIKHQFMHNRSVLRAG